MVVSGQVYNGIVVTKALVNMAKFLGNLMA